MSKDKRIIAMENAVCKYNLEKLTKELDFVEYLFVEYDDDCYVGKTEHYLVLFIDDIVVAFINHEDQTKFNVLCLAESIFAYSVIFKFRKRHFQHMINRFFEDYSDSDLVFKYKPIFKENGN